MFDLHHESLDRLFASILKLESVEECYRFFEDVCTVKEIRDIAQFAGSLPGVERIHLLPYHRLGQDKYDGLGREYMMPDILPPTNEHMEMLKKTVEANCRLECQIGG